MHPSILLLTLSSVILESSSAIGSTFVPLEAPSVVYVFRLDPLASAVAGGDGVTIASSHALTDSEDSLELVARLLGALGRLFAGIAAGIVVGLEMAWDTWWALVFGFTVTGAIREFVSEEKLTAYLGDDSWRSVAYGTVFGASSSSCSFSAVATTRSLFTKGASPAASLGAFQFASTDLVLELALVVLILLGWQFVAAEILGGLVAVVILAIVYRRFVPEEWVETARDHARSLEELECASCGMNADPTDDETIVEAFDGERRYFCCGGCHSAYDPANDREAITAGPELFSAERWGRATANAIREWDMLWRDIAFGFLLAGLLAVLVPDAWWTALFGVGSDGSALRVISNVVIGAVVGVLTFLCSVGNVPFALVLWQNGVSFGGVLAFIFADMLIIPLVRTYRRYYGTRMAATMFVAFFLAAVGGGLVVQVVFGGLGLIPPPAEAGGTVPGTYAALLNVVATPLLFAQVYVALEPHQRRRLGDRLAPHVAGVLYRTYAVVRRVAYALESRGLK